MNRENATSIDIALVPDPVMQVAVVVNIMWLY